MKLKRLLLLAGLGCAISSPAQEIRRALPVEQSPPREPIEIRRALPVQPLPLATATPLPAPPLAPASVNDTARFLAGLPVSGNSSLLPLTRASSWREHATVFDQAWTKLNALQFAGIRDWEANYLPQASGPIPVAFYLFSGPDYLYANQFFPNASTYVLAGTEPIGPLPDVARLTGPALEPALHNFEKALNSVLSFSFFITKDMKTDLQQEQLQGTLPIFYVFLARAGKTITDITFLSLDQSGNPQINGPATAARKGPLTPGVRITFAGAPGSAPQTLYYFTTDLSDEGIRSHPGFVKFCEQLGLGQSLLKSASYLMFEPGFTLVRDFLLTHSTVLIQDDSGIPIADFAPEKWDLRLFGSYGGPIDLFKQHFQPQLQSLYQASHPPPLAFGIGYRWRRSQTTVIVGLHR